MLDATDFQEVSMARSFTVSRGVAGVFATAVLSFLAGCGGGNGSGGPLEPPPRVATATVVAGNPYTSGNSITVVLQFSVVAIAKPGSFVLKVLQPAHALFR